MPIVLGAFLCVSPWPILLLGLFCAVVCTLELERLVQGRVWPGTLFLGCLMAPIFSSDITNTLGRLHSQLQPAALSILIVVGLVVGVLAARASTKTTHKTIAPFLASAWFLIPLWSLVMLHSLGRTLGTWNIANPMLMSVVPLWAGDTVAIFAGKLFGKRLLMPTISPKKTVEGAIGNLLACVGMAWLLASPLHFPVSLAIISGGVAGVFGQAGDLFESFIKRQAGVKDSGGLLPGHGGLLDRLDSVFFTAPIVAAVLLLYGPIPHVTDNLFTPVVMKVNIRGDQSRSSDLVAR